MVAREPQSGIFRGTGQGSDVTASAQVVARSCPKTPTTNPYTKTLTTPTYIETPTADETQQGVTPKSIPSSSSKRLGEDDVEGILSAESRAADGFWEGLGFKV